MKVSPPLASHKLFLHFSAHTAIAGSAKSLQKELRRGLQRQITQSEAKELGLEFVPTETVEECIRNGQLLSWLMRDLSGSDLSEMNLTGADLARINLTDVNFTSSNLSRAGFRDAKVGGADFTQTILSIPLCFFDFRLLEVQYPEFWKYAEKLLENLKIKESRLSSIPPLVTRLRWDLQDLSFKEMKKLGNEKGYVIASNFDRTIRDSRERIYEALILQRPIRERGEKKKEEKVILKTFFWNEFKRWWVETETPSNFSQHNQTISTYEWKSLPDDFWYQLTERFQITPQDLEFLKLYLEYRHSYRDVARALGVGEKTVRNHLTALLEKLPEQETQDIRKEELRESIWALYENWVDEQNLMTKYL